MLEEPTPLSPSFGAAGFVEFRSNRAHLKASVGAPRVRVLLSPADLELIRQRARESGRMQGDGAESSELDWAQIDGWTVFC